MSIADLKAQALQLYDTFNSHDPSAVAALYAPDARVRDCAHAQPLIGHEQIAAAYARLFVGLPDAHMHVERLVGEGLTVSVEWTLSGNHNGRLMGIPPTGKSVACAGVSILTFRGKAIMDSRVIWDLAGLLRQLGLLAEAL